MTEIPESLIKAATVYPYLLFLSVLFLSATVMVYILLPQLRDANGIMVMSYVSSMAIYYTGLGIIQIVPDMPKTICASLRKRNVNLFAYRGRERIKMSVTL